MANLNPSFLVFNKKIEITASKETSLKRSRDALKDRITKYFKENHKDFLPSYYIQGSYKMRNIIQTKDDLCDLDLGIHFERQTDLSGNTLQEWVLKAVNGHSSEQVHKKKCIRVIYSGDYHIDLPIYKHDDIGLPLLAVKNEDYEESDPRAFVDWHQSNKTDQSHRLSKYLKAWGDNVRHNMLSGLAMTILAVEHHYDVEGRDDQALLNTLRKIRSKLSSSWQVIMPTRPFDNVIAKHDSGFRTRFFTALDEFIYDAQTAIQSGSDLTASLLWQKHLGERFPLPIETKTHTEENASLTAIASRARTNPWKDDLL